MNARSRRAGYEWQPAQGDAWEEWDDAERPRGRRRRIGLFSPLRLLLMVVVVIAAGVAFYGMFMQQAPTQMPMSITGLGLLAVAAFLLAMSLARAAAQMGRNGQGGKALFAALVGGVFILGAAGAAAGAIVLAMLVAL
jgi:hypothetical protein